MGEPERLSTLPVIRDMLVNSAGGFLRNVRWEKGVTCDLCAGIPNPGFSTCYQCSSWVLRTDLADRLGFVTYAVERRQSGWIMYGYKDRPPNEANRRVVTMMHHYAVLKHWPCLNNSSHGRLTHWTTVPSLKGRAGVHPLATLATPLLGRNLEHIDLRAADSPVNTRDLRSANFVAEVPRGAHVLLVEDAWVGGGRLQSSAAALKLAGAKAVTALVLARWLDPDRGNTKDFMTTLQLDFDPDVCPFTGGTCA